jgi:excisionase family DNA binding protein
MNQLLSVPEAASLLRLSPHTLYRWVFQGRVPTVRLGRRLLFDPDALRDWVLERSRTGAPASSERLQTRPVGEKPDDGFASGSAPSACSGEPEALP